MENQFSAKEYEIIVSTIIRVLKATLSNKQHVEDAIRMLDKEYDIEAKKENPDDKELNINQMATMYLKELLR